ncbi:FeoC-like transcriptional regulator [Dickeya undicola]|nr:FeoC-like transcriptional regulator [Dickeya undicola]
MMTLLELRDFVRERKKVSLQDISTTFKTDPGVVEGMLAVWVQKGKIRFHSGEAAPKCGSCCGCDKSLGQYYEWL